MFYNYAITSSLGFLYENSAHLSHLKSQISISCCQIIQIRVINIANKMKARHGDDSSCQCLTRSPLCIVTEVKVEAFEWHASQQEPCGTGTRERVSRIEENE